MRCPAASRCFHRRLLLLLLLPSWIGEYNEAAVVCWWNASLLPVAALHEGWGESSEHTCAARRSQRVVHAAFSASAAGSPPASGVSTGDLKSKGAFNTVLKSNRDFKRVLNIQEGFEKGP